MTVKKLETRPAEDGESIIITNPDEHLGIQIQGPDDAMNDWELFTLYREEDDIVRLRRECKVVWASDVMTLEELWDDKENDEKIKADLRRELVEIRPELDKSARTLIAALEENGKLREERDKALGAIELRERDLRDARGSLESSKHSTEHWVKRHTEAHKELRETQAELKRVKGQRDHLVEVVEEHIFNHEENEYEPCFTSDLEKEVAAVKEDKGFPETWEKERTRVYDSKRALEKELQLARDATAGKEKQLQATQETASRIRGQIDWLKDELTKNHSFTIGDAGFAVRFAVETLDMYKAKVEQLRADAPNAAELEALREELEKSKRWAETLDDVQKKQAECIRRRNDQRARLQTQITALDTELEAVKAERNQFSEAIRKAFEGHLPGDVVVLTVDAVVAERTKMEKRIEEREEEIGGWALGHIELAKSIYRLRRELQLRDNQLQSTWDELIVIEEAGQYIGKRFAELRDLDYQVAFDRMYLDSYEERIEDLERQNQALRMQNGHVEPLEKYLLENYREDLDNGETAIGNAIRLLKALDHDNDATIRSLQNLITERDELLVSRRGTTPDEILPSGTARFVVPVSGSSFLALRRGGTSSFNDPKRKLQIDLVPDWPEDFDPMKLGMNVSARIEELQKRVDNLGWHHTNTVKAFEGKDVEIASLLERVGDLENKLPSPDSSGLLYRKEDSLRVLVTSGERSSGDDGHWRRCKCKDAHSHNDCHLCAHHGDDQDDCTSYNGEHSCGAWFSLKPCYFRRAKVEKDQNPKEYDEKQPSHFLDRHSRMIHWGDKVRHGMRRDDSTGWTVSTLIEGVGNVPLFENEDGSREQFQYDQELRELFKAKLVEPKEDTEQWPVCKDEGQDHDHGPDVCERCEHGERPNRDEPCSSCEDYGPCYFQPKDRDTGDEDFEEAGRLTDSAVADANDTGDE